MSPGLESKLIIDATNFWWDGEGQSLSLPSPAGNIVERVRSKKILRIIGPCAAQTLDQLLSIAAVICGYADAMRAPDKKPRTRPLTPEGEPHFEGIGHGESVPMYQEVVRRYPSLPIAVEVMDGDDVNVFASMAVGCIGLVWSGSRTQERNTMRGIGMATAKAGVLVMVKNPLAPDPSLYLGMIENLIIGAGQDVPPLMVCIRGTTPCDINRRGRWRNVSNLDWIGNLREAFPKLPIIIDPSHMVRYPDHHSTKRVIELIRRGMDCGASGYMVEVHHPRHVSLTDPGENVFILMDMLDKYGLI